MIMGRPNTCLGTLWCCVIINSPIFITIFLNGEIFGLIVYIIFIAGLIALTIHYRYKPGSLGSWNAKRNLRNQMNARKYEKDKYVMCPKCKHLVSSEYDFCQNCNNQM